MVHRTTQVTSAPGSQPDVMEPISVDAMQQIANARSRCVEILELCDGLDAQLKAQFRNKVQGIRAALTGLQNDVEQMMEIGEPAPDWANWPQIYQAIQAIESLGHEARFMVVDWTRYSEVYPYIGQVGPVLQ